MTALGPSPPETAPDAACVLRGLRDLLAGVSSPSYHEHSPLTFPDPRLQQLPSSPHAAAHSPRLHEQAYPSSRSAERRQARERLLTELSASFIGHTSQDMHEAMAWALERLGRFLDTDRCSLMLWDAEGECLEVSHCWSVTADYALDPALAVISPSQAPWAARRLRQGKPIAISDLDSLPPGAASMRAVMLLRHLQALYVVPMMIHDELVGALALSSCDAPRTWDEDAQATLEAASDLFANALRHKWLGDALRQSERRFREMADLLPDMLFELDRRFVVTYWNREAFQVLGYTVEDLEHDLSFIHLLEVNGEAAAAEGFRRRSGRSIPWVEVYDVRRKDGTYLPLEIHTAPLLGPEGRLEGFRGVMRDITNRRELENAQRLASVGQLAAGVAHEFNNLMAVMQGRAELALMFQSPDMWQRLADSVLTSCHRGADVVRGLQSMTQPGTPKRQALHIEEPLEAAIAVVQRGIQQPNVHICRDFRTNGHYVLADHDQLQQVFANLIINAYHAMPSGGMLVFHTRHEPAADGAGEIVVLVSDTGCGIAPENLPKVFEPFFTTKGRLGDSDVPGTGLGLSVSRGIIQAHGGVISVRSSVDGGASFEMRLQAFSEVQALPFAGSDEGPLPLDEAMPVRTILVADDEDDIRDMLCSILGECGFGTLSAGTTTDAISILRRQGADLVLSDLTMPGGDGHLILETARALPESPPVLFLTGHTEAGLEEALIAQGAAGYLRKPFSIRELVNAVNLHTS